MPNERTRTKQYRLRTRLIHRSGRWDYDHHVVPPQSSSATYCLSNPAAPIVRLADAGGGG